MAGVYVYTHVCTCVLCGCVYCACGWLHNHGPLRHHMPSPSFLPEKEQHQHSQCRSGEASGLRLRFPLRHRSKLAEALEPSPSTWRSPGLKQVWQWYRGVVSRGQFSLVIQSGPTPCNPMDCSTPGLPVHHQPPELTQTHVHWVSDVIQPSHPLSSPSPPAFNLSQHQGIFQWVSSLHQVAKVLKLQL